MDSSAVIARHRAAGRTFTAGGVQSFVRSAGFGPPVLCMHGVPASSFLYRKVLAELDRRGLRGVAFDLPGLGLAGRPTDFDYTWTGLGRFAAAAVDVLELQRFHLVVHDLGGPVGFEVAAAMPERILSMTILNTLIEVDSFKKPWVMRPFEIRGVGEAYLKTLSKPLFRWLMAWQGIADMSQVTKAELDAYVDLLKRDDGGAAYLRIMRGFETTRAKRDKYVTTVHDVPYPVQVVWGEADPALPLKTMGRQAQAAAGVDHIRRLPGKHFLQEDNAPQLAELIASFAQEG